MREGRGTHDDVDLLLIVGQLPAPRARPTTFVSSVIMFDALGVVPAPCDGGREIRLVLMVPP